MPGVKPHTRLGGLCELPRQAHWLFRVTSRLIVQGTTKELVGLDNRQAHCPAGQTSSSCTPTKNPVVQGTTNNLIVHGDKQARPSMDDEQAHLSGRQTSSVFRERQTTSFLHFFFKKKYFKCIFLSSGRQTSSLFTQINKPLVQRTTNKLIVQEARTRTCRSGKRRGPATGSGLLSPSV